MKDLFSHPPSSTHDPILSTRWWRLCWANLQLPTNFTKRPRPTASHIRRRRGWSESWGRFRRFMTSECYTIFARTQPLKAPLKSTTVAPKDLDQLRWLASGAGLTEAMLEALLSDPGAGGTGFEAFATYQRSSFPATYPG